jgi:hypothetical protein
MLHLHNSLIPTDRRHPQTSQITRKQPRGWLAVAQLSFRSKRLRHQPLLRSLCSVGPVRPQLENGDFEFAELVGVSITKILLMGLIDIQFGEGSQNLHIQIETPFQITGASGESVAIKYQPWLADPPTGLDKLAELHNATVRAAVAHVDELQLDLSTQHGEQVTLRVPPDPQYEAWHFTGPLGVFVSTPGGSSGRRHR